MWLDSRCGLRWGGLGVKPEEGCGWHGAEGMGRRDGAQSWLGQREGDISGHTQHPHDVGVARARSPACHHNHQVSNVEEATKLSWGGGRR